MKISYYFLLFGSIIWHNLNVIRFFLINKLIAELYGNLTNQNVNLYNCQNDLLNSIEIIKLFKVILSQYKYLNILMHTYLALRLSQLNKMSSFRNFQKLSEIPGYNYLFIISNI